MLYTDKLRVSLGMKAFWGTLISLFLVIGLLSHEPFSYAVNLGLTGFFLLMALALTPKELRVYSDRLIVKLHLGYSVTVPAGNLKEVRKLPKQYVYLSQDVPFKSRWSVPVHIIQKRGLSFVVTPSNPDEFIAHVISLIHKG